MTEPTTCRACGTPHVPGAVEHIDTTGPLPIHAPTARVPIPAADLFPVTFTEPVSHTLAEGCADPAYDDGTAAIVLTCPACLDEAGDELEAEYAIALESVRDRAQEARAGGRAILTFYRDSIRGTGRSWSISTHGQTDHLDQNAAAYVRTTRAQRDNGFHSLVRTVWPILIAGGWPTHQHEVDHDACDLAAHLDARTTGAECPLRVCLTCGPIR